MNRHYLHPQDGSKGQPEFAVAEKILVEDRATFRTGIEYIEKLESALSAAAQEAFENEVVDTQMTDNVIGNNCEFSSKEEWIASKIEEWTELK